MRFYTCQVRCRISETSTVSQNWPLIAIDCWFGRTLSKNSLPKNWCLKKTGEFWFVRSIVVLQKCLRKSVDQRPRNSCNRRCRCQELNGILEKQPGPEVLEQLEQYQDWQQRHSTKKNPIETEGTGKLVTSWWLGLGIRFLDFLGYIHIWYTYIYIFPMNTDMSRQTRTVFVFRNSLEVWWPTVKNDTFFVVVFPSTFWKEFCCFPSSPGYKTFPSWWTVWSLSGSRFIFAKHFWGMGPPYQPQTQICCPQKIPTSKPKKHENSGDLCFEVETNESHA